MRRTLGRQRLPGHRLFADNAVGLSPVPRRESGYSVVRSFNFHLWSGPHRISAPIDIESRRPAPYIGRGKTPAAGPRTCGSFGVLRTRGSGVGSFTGRDTHPCAPGISHVLSALAATRPPRRHLLAQRRTELSFGDLPSSEEPRGSSRERSLILI